MKESIGSTFLYNIMFVFIIIVFGLLTSTMSYYKGFKVNTRILSIIQKYSGYNAQAREEIEGYLSSIGYTQSANGQSECAEKRDGGQRILASDLSSEGTSYLYCVYYFRDARGAKESGRTNKDGDPIYYNYSVVSYIYIDLPIVGQFKIPVYSKGERLYNYSDRQRQKGA